MKVRFESDLKKGHDYLEQGYNFVEFIEKRNQLYIFKDDEINERFLTWSEVKQLEITE